MWCVQTLGSQNWRSAYPFLQPNVPLSSSFRSRFWVFWVGKRTCSGSISIKAFFEWYKHLMFISCDVCKHLEVKIAVAHILLYIQTYLCLAVSDEQDCGNSGVVYGLVREVSVSRPFLNDTNILYPMWCTQTLGSQNWRSTHLFLQPNVPPFSSFRAIFGCSGVVNGLVHVISVPRPFLNDTHILYIFYAMYTNIWMSKLQWRLSLFLHPNIPPFSGFRGVRFWAF